MGISSSKTMSEDVEEWAREEEAIRRLMYHVAPRWNILHEATREYRLGSVITNPASCDQITRGDAGHIAVPRSPYKLVHLTNVRDVVPKRIEKPGERERISKTTRFFRRLASAMPNAKDKGEIEYCFGIRCIESSTFDPNVKYINSCLELPSVVKHFHDHSCDIVYLVTGVKVAQGVVVTKRKKGRKPPGDIVFSTGEPRYLALRILKIRKRSPDVTGHLPNEEQNKSDGTAVSDTGANDADEEPQFTIMEMQHDHELDLHEDGHTWCFPV